MRLDPALALIVLTQVKEQLEQREAKFICTAIRNIDSQHLQQTCDTLREYVHVQLEYQPTLMMWVEMQGYNMSSRHYASLVDRLGFIAADEHYETTMRQCRTAWIDKMLSVISTEGILP